MTQVHTRFSDHQVKELIERYIHHEIDRTYIQQMLGIGKSRFFILLQRYREDPEGFSIVYTRHKKTRGISPIIEGHILEELTVDKTLIDDPDVPIRRYNYSYIKDRLESIYHERVSLPTIIDRAKKNGFYRKHPRKAIHDREVMTRYAGELIQHDASLHLWSPPAQKKWYLITSLDDYSRFILYAAFVEKETSMAHITSLEAVFLRYGMPFSYYVDSHSIFRFVRGRDSFWQKHLSLTDEATPQWKQILDACNVKVTYALSPQAKGKIERPYGWLQDRVTRTCVRENVTDINHGRAVLRHELDRYNYQQVHSTTMEIPFVRFQNALSQKKSLFREFSPKPPFESVKDIFCVRIERTVDAYRTISLHNLRLKVNNATPRDMLDIHVYPLNDEIIELRFWRSHQLLDIQKIKIDEVEGVHF